MRVIEGPHSYNVAPKPKSRLGVRHAQTMLLFLGLVLAFALRVNMSVAILAMTDSSNETFFNWSIKIQGVILSSFFWGNVVLQIPGGILAAKVGGKRLILTSISSNSILTLLLPMGAYYGGWGVVTACRILQGVAQGLVYPAMHHLISKWIPLEEKGRLGGLIYAGSPLGTGIQLMVSGFISSAWGWEAIFYSLGALCMVWSALYLWIGSDSPQHSSLISDEERAYIQTSLGHVDGHKKLPTPWHAIWTSLPFWSLMVVHGGQNWGFWTLLTEMPSYMSQVLGLDIKQNGVFTALPYLVLFLFTFPMGAISDLAIRRKWVSITAARKISNSIAHFIPALTLIGLSYSPAGNVTVAVLLLTMTVGFNAGHISGFLVCYTICFIGNVKESYSLELVHTDMAPNYSGELMGLTNFFANLVSLGAPMVAGLIIEDAKNQKEWRAVFFLSSTVYIVCNLFFVVFGTCKTQEWNEPKSEAAPAKITRDG